MNTKYFKLTFEGNTFTCATVCTLLCLFLKRHVHLLDGNLIVFSSNCPPPLLMTSKTSLQSLEPAVLVQILPFLQKPVFFRSLLSQVKLSFICLLCHRVSQFELASVNTTWRLKWAPRVNFLVSLRASYDVRQELWRSWCSELSHGFASGNPRIFPC